MRKVTLGLCSPAPCWRRPGDALQGSKELLAFEWRLPTPTLQSAARGFTETLQPERLHRRTPRPRGALQRTTYLL
ncbi:hypothetical protein EYF80_040149 [Liparis tanakae]|uniref:Uncharacterized protein n=1 Tax=Liparis tanakae TaxID=230148 RepID=A0A4Z2GAN5_9TELE|nr:hypothetical protein EYF80_040149 [Liparis tanakae]